MYCPVNLQQKYLKQVQERNRHEKSQFKEVVHHYMDILRQLKKIQDQNKQLERENYAIKQTKGDAMQMVKMEQHVRELEAQLNDMYKGQMGNSQEVLKQVRENKDLADKLRDYEKKSTLYQERLKEYEDIMARQQEEYDRMEQQHRVMKSEYDGMKQINQHLEGRVKELSMDNSNLVSKILSLKDEQAKALNEANKIYMEAQRIKGGGDPKKVGSQEEEKQQISFGSPINLDEFIKPEYLIMCNLIQIKKIQLCINQICFQKKLRGIIYDEYQVENKKNIYSLFIYNEYMYFIINLFIIH